MCFWYFYLRKWHEYFSTTADEKKSQTESSVWMNRRQHGDKRTRTIAQRDEKQSQNGRPCISDSIDRLHHGNASASRWLAENPVFLTCVWNLPPPDIHLVIMVLWFPSSSSFLASSFYSMFVVSSGVSGVSVLVVFFFPFLNTKEHTMTTDELCNATDCNLYNKLSFITKVTLCLHVWFFHNKSCQVT